MLKELLTSNIYVLDLKTKKILSVFFNSQYLKEYSDYAQLYKTLSNKFGAELMSNPISFIFDSNKEKFIFFQNQETNEMTVYTEANIEENILLKNLRDRSENLNYYNYNKNSHELFFKSVSHSPKLLSANILSSYQNEGAVFSQLTNGSWVLFKPHKNPLLIGVDVLSQDKRQIQLKIEETKRLVQNLSVNSKININFKSLCFFLDKNNGQGRVQSCH
jgi:hypothetical protein